MRVSFSRGTLLLENASRCDVVDVFGDLPWQWDARVRAWRVDALRYPGVHANLARWNDAVRGGEPLVSLPSGEQRKMVVDEVPTWQKIHWPRLQLKPLRPEQQAAVVAWNQSGAGAIVMPTGTGKTEVALAIMAELSVSTLVVAPVRDLMYQWHRRIQNSLGYDAGIIGDNVFRVQPVSVTTYDSACIHMERLGNQFGLIVFDECHHLPGNMRRDAARMCAAPFRLGLTATLQRSDGRHSDLDDLIGPVAYELKLAEVRGRTLADYEVVRVPIHLTPSEQSRYDRLSAEVRDYVAERRKTEPHFSWEQLCDESSSTPQARHALKSYRAKKAIEDRAAEKLRVLEDIFRLHCGEPCLIFAGSNAMARDVSRRFLIPCLLNHCGKRERREVLEGFETGVYPAIVANQVLDEGVDMPAVKVAVVLGGNASTRQAKQRLGRVLRKSGNLRAVLYEIVCRDTNEETRSRRRRASDAYEGTKHRKDV